MEPEGLGSQGSSAWAVQGLMGSWEELGTRVHTCACASIIMCVHACVCTELPFPQSLLWGREGMRAGEERGMLNRDTALGWFLQGWIRPGGRAAPVLGAGLASSSSKHPLHQARAANLRSPPRVVPPSCARGRPHVPQGRVPPSLAISSPFQLNALSFIF